MKRLACEPQKFPLGILQSSPDGGAFHLSEAQLFHHSCVLGQTGSGKSKFLELLMRYLTVHGTGGFCLIDPHGDLSEDLLAFLRYRMVMKGDRELIKRFHYLEPSFEQVFHYDPFRFPDFSATPEHLQPAKIASWIETQAFALGEIVQRKQGKTDFEAMNRLQRVITAVLVAVGTPVVKRDGRRQHLPLSDVLVLLDPGHPRHGEVYDAVRPVLWETNEQVSRDLDRLRGLYEHNPRQYATETESTVNRLRSFLSPLVRSIFARQTDTIDFRSIIQNGDILLVNLRKTNTFSADQRSAIGGMFIHELLTTAENEEREHRKPFHLIIDEAAEFIGGDIQQALGIMRKFKLSLCLAAQDLSSFKKGELDLRPKVLSQCGTKITFAQSWPEDLEALAVSLGLGNVSFEKYFQVTDRPDGYDFIPMREYSHNFTWNDSWSDTRSKSRGDSLSHTYAVSKSENANWSVGESDSESRGGGMSEGETAVLNWANANAETLVKCVPHSSSATKSSGISRGRQSQASASWSDQHGVTRQSGGGVGKSETRSVGESESRQSGRSHTDGGGSGTGMSFSDKLLVLARHREEIVETPNLVKSVMDQIWKMKQDIFRLTQGQCVAKVLGDTTAHVVKVHFVSEKWADDADKFAEVRKAKELIRRQHAYYGVPEFGGDAQNRRLTEFVTDPEPKDDKPGSDNLPFA